MTFDEVKAYYGNSYRFMKDSGTGMVSSNWYYWKKKGYIPYEAQKRIMKATGGALVARFEDVPE